MHILVCDDILVFNGCYACIKQQSRVHIYLSFSCIAP